MGHGVGHCGARTVWGGLGWGAIVMGVLGHLLGVVLIVEVRGVNGMGWGIGILGILVWMI